MTEGSPLSQKALGMCRRSAPSFSPSVALVTLTSKSKWRFATHRSSSRACGRHLCLAKILEIQRESRDPMLCDWVHPLSQESGLLAVREDGAMRRWTTKRCHSNDCSPRPAAPCRSAGGASPGVSRGNRPTTHGSPRRGRREQAGRINMLSIYPIEIAHHLLFFWKNF